MLGFVLLFTDLTERKAAESAAKAVPGRASSTAAMSTPGSSIPVMRLLFRTLLSAVVENAQLAALEITDGVEPARMPQMLGGVRASVARDSRGVAAPDLARDELAAAQALPPIIGCRVNFVHQPEWQGSLTVSPWPRIWGAGRKVPRPGDPSERHRLDPSRVSLRRNRRPG